MLARNERARVGFREHVEKRFLDFKPLHDAYLQPCTTGPAPVI